MSPLPGPTAANRIYCVGRNYRDHAREMAAEAPQRPVLFLKSGRCLPGPGPVPLPERLGQVDFEGEVALLLSGDPEQPWSGVGLGVDLTLRAIQSELKSARLPWDTAKAFDGSVLLGPFSPWPSALAPDLSNLCFETWINGRLRQQGQCSDMLFGPAALLAEIQRFWRPQAGDVILTGTPAGVGPLSPGDVIEMIITDPPVGFENPRWEMEAHP